MTVDNRRAVVEALLFASSKPLSIDNLFEASEIDKEELKEILAALQEEYSSDSRGFSLEEVANGFQLRSDPRFSTQIGRLFAARSRRRITRSGLESLSIIAYRQPVTKAEVEHIRGVDSGAVLKTLLSLTMIRILGRKEAPGRPILYGTTREFLEYFGLRDIESLPTLEEVTELLEEEEDSFETEKRRNGETEGEELLDDETERLSDESRNEEPPDDETERLSDESRDEEPPDDETERLND
jgi:segregation and condensation protein B